jgi:DnaJ-class molecular chaperone
MPRRSETSEEDVLAQCPQCRGTGMIADLLKPEQMNMCSRCQGSGRVARTSRRDKL